MKLPPRSDSTELPGREIYRKLTVGDHLSITGERGSFTLRWVDEHGNLTCWGGRDGFERMRTFRPEQVKTVHRKPRASRDS